MATRKYRNRRRHRTRRYRGGKTGKKWTTAVEAAQKTLAKTGSVSAASAKLRKQTLSNVRSLFGSVGKI